ncbi:hypothetical protein [Rhodococcus sp. Eu-32]|uniref:hypothetical protein n=1 Tax=Rhodococcus sp. Eu-32 TaxID=1017319 RepID=UPI001A9DC35F|nr:hypothetical protein [Rhodococcus sp. Eu-32]
MALDVEPEIPSAVAKRIAKAVEFSRYGGRVAPTLRDGVGSSAGPTAKGMRRLPAHPVTVAAYLVDAAGTRAETGERAYAVATIGTWLAAINHQHRTTCHLPPSAHEPVTVTLAGIRRSGVHRRRGPAPHRNPRYPLLVDDIKVLVTTARERCGFWADEVLERIELV